MSDRRWRLTVVGLCLAVPSSGAAQDGHVHDQPYAGLESREVNALSAEEIAALEAGQGMGFALAAELNGYPGPRHVLELREELGLTPEQEAATEQIFERMEVQARAEGAKLIALESELDLAFRSGTVDAESLNELLPRIGQTRARLRATHLEAHLELMEHLTRHQVHLYGELRAYGSGHQGGAGG